MVLHFLYGIGAGWVFALAAASGLLALTPLSLVNGVVNGAVYGLILTVVAAVVWMPLVYGVVLGAFLGLGILV